MGRRHAFSLGDLLPATGLSAEVDLLVIGAGAAGTQAALAATSAGASVMVVDTLAAGLADGAGPRSAARLRWQGGQAATRLLHDAQGRVCGATGVSVPDERSWQVLATVVVLATGRDAGGLLLAAQAGLRLLARADGGPAVDVLSADGHTTVPGLLVTGEAAVPSPTSGLPLDSVAGAMLRGRRCGLAAAVLAEQHAPAGPQPALPPAPASAAGAADGVPAHSARSADPLAARAALAAVVASLPAQGSPTVLRSGLSRLDALWALLDDAAPPPRGRQRFTHETRAALAMARWQLAARLAPGQVPALPGNRRPLAPPLPLPPAAAQPLRFAR